MSKLDQVARELEAAKKVYKTKVDKIKEQGTLKAAFQEFFQNNPKIKAIYWNQYIPSFNDGDPCVFTINEVLQKNQEFDDEFPNGHPYDGEDGWRSVDAKEVFIYNKEKDPATGKTWHKEPNPEYNPDAAAIGDFIYDNEKLMEDLFGVNVYILVTPEKIIVEEYDCGY